MRVRCQYPFTIFLQIFLPKPQKISPFLPSKPQKISPFLPSESPKNLCFSALSPLLSGSAWAREV